MKALFLRFIPSFFKHHFHNWFCDCSCWFIIQFYDHDFLKPDEPQHAEYWRTGFIPSERNRLTVAIRFAMIMDTANPVRSRARRLNRIWSPAAIARHTQRLSTTICCAELKAHIKHKALCPPLLLYFVAPSRRPLILHFIFLHQITNKDLSPANFWNIIMSNRYMIKWSETTL